MKIFIRALLFLLVLSAVYGCALGFFWLFLGLFLGGGEDLVRTGAFTFVASGLLLASLIYLASTPKGGSNY